MTRPHIPRTWTGEQALEMADLLQCLIDDIWSAYRDEILLAYRKRNPPPELRSDHDDDPF